MKKNRIKKYILYTVTILIFLGLIGGVLGIRYFNSIWFKERADYLIISSDFKPIKFKWTESSYGDFIEKKDAILIPAKIARIKNRLNFQFDTGATTTTIYRESLESLKKMGNEIREVKRDEKNFAEEIKINLGGSQIILKMVEIDNYYGKSFTAEDTIESITIGTIGADFLNKYITEIDFKNQEINFYKNREKWMSINNSFTSFDFTGRRFMLPCEIDKNKIDLLYDSGTSAFGLITTKNRYLSYSDNDSQEIAYNANGHGNAIPVKHRKSDKIIKIGGSDLELKRISFVDMYSSFQGLISPFTRIGGWLGNKPFINYSLIFDVDKEEFVVIEK